MKIIKRITLLLFVVAFFITKINAQTFPVTNLIVHGWQKFDTLPRGTADTILYKSVLYNLTDNKLYFTGNTGGGSGSVDSIFTKYCSGCAMTTGWKTNGDTIFIDTSYVKFM